MMQHLMAPVPEHRGVRSDLPRRIGDIIEQSLAKEPDERFPTAGAVAAAVAQLALAKHQRPTPSWPSTGG